ncbi:MAG: pyridoxamine 5'-phosphate oxidase family protein [Desulfobacter sp.]
MPTDSSAGEARKRCLSMISHAKVMTIGTGGNAPWTAPVYYLYRDRFFYFFSSPESRHIRMGKDTPCAAAIFRDDPEMVPDMSALQGLQMSGRIDACSPGAETVGVAVAYARRYGISPLSKDILKYFKDRFHARFYRFIAQECFYMDNQMGFGHRTKIEL